MTEHDDAGFPDSSRRDTFASDGVRSPTDELGIETRQQKAELEAALFGEPSAPVEIAHYTVIGTLGTGGMGVVYVAHDRKLERRVALKLLRHPGSGGTAQARLLREAQAMARLAHPNVVTVHEVGTHEGLVFVAMEFVGGSNLRAWLQMEPRKWEDIRAIFVQAGEGLVAAHEAGIIHRDFKPDNVLVGDDGRVRVADFGLAHGLASGESEMEAFPSISEGNLSYDSLSLDVPLTETGALVGTPAYMAPEQHAGRRVDARCDQFSFCVALWEAFYGQRPFEGATLPELLSSLRVGRIAQPKDLHGVPPWLHEVLLRGMRTYPGARWPSMRHLLTALTRDPEAVRRRRLRNVVVATVIGGVIAGLGVRASSERLHNLRQGYWNTLTEGLLEIERERGLAQATDDARRARNATRMSGYRRYRPKAGTVDHEDPTVAAALLREIEGEGRESEPWISAANNVLGQSLSHAVLGGHGNLIVDLAFTPDGATLYSASNDGEVRQWQTATGAGQPIIRHQREVVDLALSPDGRTVVSASKDGRVQLWSSEVAGSRVIAEHDDELRAVVFDPTGEWVASAAVDGSVRLTALDGHESRPLEAHEGPIYALSFDAEGERLLTAGADRRARLWRVEGAKLEAEFVGHTDAVYHARFVDQRRIVTGSDDRTLRLWTIGAPATSTVLTSHGGPITSIDVHGEQIASADQRGEVHVISLDGGAPVMLEPPAAVWSLRFLADGEHLITGSWDGSAQLWSTKGGSALRTFLGHGLPVMRVAADPTGRWLATASYDLDVRLWDLERELLSTSLTGHSDQISDLALSRDDSLLATASHDGSVRLWDTAEGRELAALVSESSISSLTFSPDDKILATATGKGTVELWDVETHERRILAGHEREVWRVAFDSSGARLASASFDGTVRVWGVADGEEQLVLEEPGQRVTDVQFEPGDRRIVSGVDDGSVSIWNAETGELVTRLRGHTGRIWELARSPDGKTLASASDDGTARLWPDDNPAHAIILEGHRQPVWSVVFDASGERVLTASYDNDAKIWRVADGTLLRTLSGHSEAIWAATFTPDGGVVTASDDNTLRVWPAEPGASVIVLSGHAEAVTQLALDAKGELLVSGSTDTTVKLWNLGRFTTDVEALQGRLQAATTWCLDVDLRVRELGEDPVEAARAEAACAARYGR